MTLALRLSTQTADVETDAIVGLLDGGYLRIYTGNQPDTADDEETANGSDLLAELRFQSPAFQASQGGVAMAYELENGIALMTGDASWFRTVRADGYTVVFDGSVGEQNANMIMNSVQLQRSATVLISGFNYASSR